MKLLKLLKTWTATGSEEPHEAGLQEQQHIQDWRRKMHVLQVRNLVLPQGRKVFLFYRNFPGYILFKIGHGAFTSFKFKSLFDLYVNREDPLSFLPIDFLSPPSLLYIHDLNFQLDAWAFYHQES